MLVRVGIAVTCPVAALRFSQLKAKSVLRDRVYDSEVLASKYVEGKPANYKSKGLYYSCCTRFSESSVSISRGELWRQRAPGVCRGLIIHAVIAGKTAKPSLFNSKIDEQTFHGQNGDDCIPVLSLAEVAERLQSVAPEKSKQFRAMYSSIIGAITTDPAAMVIPLDDHMVHRGHGVFDTALIYHGNLYELDAHLDRLLRSAAMSKITPPFDRATLRRILVQTVATSGCKLGSLRYWLSAGRGGFGLSPAECAESTFYAVVYSNIYSGPEGVKVITSTVPIKPPMFATVKSVNYLPNVLAQMEAEEKGAFTAVWLDQEGLIAEGPNMNLAFLSKDGLLLVPPCDKVLAGCNAQRMLHLINQLVPEKAIPGLNGVKIQNLTVAEAKDAVEMMLIGSGVLVKPIVEWDGEPVGDGQPGPVTLAIREALQQDIENPSSAVLVPVPYKALS